MRLPLICTAVATALSLATAASAQDAAGQDATAPAPEAAAAPVAVKNGAWIYSSDGSAIGRIDHIQEGKDGASTAAVIYQMRMVYIPVDSLSAGKKGNVTKLTRAEINKQR